MDSRECISSLTGASVEGDYHHSKIDTKSCSCPQPCNQIVYEAAFSTAKWPSGSVDVSVKVAGSYACIQMADCKNMSRNECLEYYRNNAAMIEVFYEKLNFETIRETEAYGVSQLW